MTTKKPKNKKKKNTNVIAKGSIKARENLVDSLLDVIRDGNEYGSIVSVLPKPGYDLLNDIVRGITNIEKIRNRPCLAYIGNVVSRDDGTSGIDQTDDLPFIELVNSVPKTERKVDVLLSTRGGSGHQVSRFVNCLRSRFDEVDFIIPSFCMSAGTLFALSGDNVFMTPQACLGPIDPQVPTKDGRYVPAQALLLLVEQLQKKGDEALKNSQAVPWSAVRIIDGIDKKELGDAITASQYSTMMASQFLLNYKFKNWLKRGSSGKAVTSAYKEARANEIASALASHDRWKNHGHAISREVLWNEIKLRIDHPDEDLEREIKRIWALIHWSFDKTNALKFIVSSNYRYIKYSTK